MNGEWHKVSKTLPCVICGKPDWCKVSADGAVALCARTEAGSFEAVKNGQGWMHRLKEDPRRDDMRRRFEAAKNGKPRPKGTSARAGMTIDKALDAAGRNIEGERVAHWVYTDLDGGEVMAVGRWDLPNGKKTCRPVFNTASGWQVGDPPGLLPLYRMPDLQSAERVFVVEGEKCVEAARSIGLVTTTSSHGSACAERSDWSPLAGKNVVLLPDNDPAGEVYAAEVHAVLIGLDPPARVRIVRLPGLPPKGDLFDYVEGRDSLESESIKAGIEAMADAAEPAAEPSDGWPALIGAGEFCAQYPEPSPPLIDGIMRLGGVGGIVSGSKCKKSHFLIHLLLSIANGRPWLGNAVRAGKVLLVDLETQKGDWSRRVQTIAAASDMSMADLHVMSLRGRPTDVDELAARLCKLPRGEFACIAIDPIYKLTPAGADENSAADVGRMMALIDQIAEATGAGVLLVHHSPKGDTSGRTTLDFGAGSGSFARSVDALIALRPHEQDDCAVLEIVCRAFREPKPIGLAWRYPLWETDSTLDTDALRTGRPAGKGGNVDPAEFAKRFLSATEVVWHSTLLARAAKSGLSTRVALSLLAQGLESRAIRCVRSKRDKRKKGYKLFAP